MREIAPCKGCGERHPACHDSCDKYKAWKERHLAQQAHLKENGYGLPIIMTDSREAGYRAYIKNGNRFTSRTKGGM